METVLHGQDAETREGRAPSAHSTTYMFLSWPHNRLMVVVQPSLSRLRVKARRFSSSDSTYILAWLFHLGVFRSTIMRLSEAQLSSIRDY